MNERAVTLVNRASGLMAQVPGTNQLLCDEGRGWTYLTLRVAEDHLVHTMAELYGLGPVQERRAARAAADGGGFRVFYSAGSGKTLRGLSRKVRLDIIGPAHVEGPEGGSAEPESNP